MKNPEWFIPELAHKAVYVGPGRLPVPLCKLTFRSFWPANGVYSPLDRVRRNWKDVECFQCSAFMPYKHKSRRSKQ